MPARLSQKLASVWVAHRPLGTAPKSFAPPLPVGERERRIRTVAWPTALVLILHFFFFRAPEASVTDDFATVYAALRRFLDGGVVYNEVYFFVDPHYLYNPGATLLLSPIALIHTESVARMTFIILNGVAIAAALALLTRMFGRSLRGAVFPISLAIAFATESVRNTLVFGNINGILLLLLVGFYACLLSGRQWWAGLLIGVAILVKPLFAPLLALSLVLWHWRTVILAAIAFIVFNLASVPFFTASRRYFTELIPYLREVRDYANASISGVSVYFHMPTWLYAACWLTIAVSVAVALIGLVRWRFTDPLLWATTSGGILFVGVFLLSSLGQQYYSILVFPTLFTVLLRRSILHAWPTVFATVAFLAPMNWENEWNLTLSRLGFQLIGPCSWALFLIAAATVIAVWWHADLQENPAQAGMIPNPDEGEPPSA